MRKTIKIILCFGELMANLYEFRVHLRVHRIMRNGNNNEIIWAPDWSFVEQETFDCLDENLLTEWDILHSVNKQT